MSALVTAMPSRRLVEHSSPTPSAWVGENVLVEFRARTFAERIGAESKLLDWVDYRAETLGRDIVERLARDMAYRKRMRLYVAELAKPPRRARRLSKALTPSESR